MSAVPPPERVVVLALDGVYPFELGMPSRILGPTGRYEVLTCT
ncbi:AraC family transcriptional regulator, partial [Streptomyces sp. Ru71]